MKIFKMITGFFLKRSRSYKIMANVIFHVKLLSPTLIEGGEEISIYHAFAAPLKATSHSTIFDIPMRLVREDQRHRGRFTR